MLCDQAFNFRSAALRKLAAGIIAAVAMSGCVELKMNRAGKASPSPSPSPEMSASPSPSPTALSASFAHSTITVSAGIVASGSGVTLTVTARDSTGAALTSGGATVAFSHAGGASTGTIGSVTDNGDGTYTATFTGVLAGSATSITATLDGSAVTTTSPTIAVTPGPASLSQSTITRSAASVASGSGVTLTLTAKDAAGNTLSGGGLTVAFAHSGGTSTGTIGSVTDNSNGTYSAIFTGVLAGTATSIAATLGGGAVTSASPTVTVIPGAVSLTQSTITRSAASVASGSAVTVTVTAKDAAGNTLSAGGLTVTVGSTGGTSTGTIGAVTDNSNGTYTALFTGVLAGTATSITAAIGGSSVTSGNPTVSVTAGPASLATSLISVSSTRVAASGSVTLTVTAKDAAGNSHTGGGLTVAFSKSGGTSVGTIGSVTDNGNGTYTATYTGTTSGTANTVSATIGGSSITSGDVAVAVVGTISASQSVVTVSASSVVSGSAVTLTFTAKDASGNQLLSGGQTVTFNKQAGGTSDGTVGTVTDNGNGTYTATFTGTTAGTARSIRGRYGATNLTSTQPTVTVTPGPLSLSGSTVAVGASVLAPAATTTITLTTKDAAGNTIASGGETVAFAATGGTSTGTIGAVTDNGNGTYTATFTAGTVGTAKTIDATIGGAAVTSAAPTITVSSLFSTSSVSMVSANHNYLGCTTGFNTAVNTAFTVSGWFRWDGNCANYGVVGLMGNADSSNNYRGLIVEAQCSDRSLQVTLNSDWGASNRLTVSSGANFVPVNSWFLVVITYAGNPSNGSLRTYVNDQEVGYDQATTLSGSITSGNPFQIGDAGAGLGEWYSGKVDEVSTWSRVLTAGELTSLYNSGRPGDLASHSATSVLTHWWRMGEGMTIPTISDSKGSAACTAYSGNGQANATIGSDTP